jgi:uncharacterized protein (DUF305 family)
MNTNSIKRTLARALAAALFIAVGVAAAAAQDHSGHTGQQQAGHSGHGQTANMPYDLHYIDMTIMHHEQGVELARLAQQKGADARVKAFAKKTADDQQRDIAVLRGHRQHWYSDRPQMDHAQIMAHMQSRPGHHNRRASGGADNDGNGRGIDHHLARQPGPLVRLPGDDPVRRVRLAPVRARAGVQGRRH